MQLDLPESYQVIVNSKLIKVILVYERKGQMVNSKGSIHTVQIISKFPVVVKFRFMAESLRQLHRFSSAERGTPVHI